MTPSRGPALVVSPHYDDAVMSAFGFLEQGADVLNVCTGRPEPAVATEWDRSIGFVDSDAALDQRQGEDDRAFAALDCARSEVGLLDHQYVAEHPSEDAHALLEHVTGWLSVHPDGVVVAPAGAGGPLTLLHRIRYKIPHPRLGLRGGGPQHPDHLWATDTLLARLDPGTTIVLYEDLPYTWVRRPDRRVAELAATSDRRAEPFTIPVDVHRKGSAIEAYTSQRDGNVAPWVTSVASVLADRERYWTLRA